jgi:hypothetical protein
MRISFRRGCAVLSALFVAVVVTATQAHAVAPRGSSGIAARRLPSLSVAERQATDLGPLPARTPVSFTLTLGERDP